jgi:hypothetical protein
MITLRMVATYSLSVRFVCTIQDNTERKERETHSPEFARETPRTRPANLPIATTTRSHAASVEATTTANARRRNRFRLSEAVESWQESEAEQWASGLGAKDSERHPRRVPVGHRAT